MNTTWYSFSERFTWLNFLHIHLLLFSFPPPQIQLKLFSFLTWWKCCIEWESVHSHFSTGVNLFKCLTKQACQQWERRMMMMISFNFNLTVAWHWQAFCICIYFCMGVFSICLLKGGEEGNFCPFHPILSTQKFTLPPANWSNASLKL